MCLTGVDYFSTLGYQPGIAFLAAGLLSPSPPCPGAAHPVRGAAGLPAGGRGEPARAGLDRHAGAAPALWRGKLFVLVLLGFAPPTSSSPSRCRPPTPARTWWRTRTSRRSCTARSVDHPGAAALLGAVFLKGFSEAIGIAVVLVGDLPGAERGRDRGRRSARSLQHPHVVTDWTAALTAEHGNPLVMVAVSLLVFPKLALGLSGFETGVAVMPQSRATRPTTAAHPPAGSAAPAGCSPRPPCIMSVFLIASSLVTTLLIPRRRVRGRRRRPTAGPWPTWPTSTWATASARSTTSAPSLILWFAGASAMAGLLNLVPRYLPRYGMAPEWAGAVRPLVLVFTASAFLITWIFDADVDAQGGAYATGVLVLMTSRRGGGHAGRPPGRPAPARPSASPSITAGLRLHHRRQRHRAARRRQDRRLLHRRDRRRLAAVPGRRAPSSSAPPRSSRRRAPSPSCATAPAARSGSSPTSRTRGTSRSTARRSARSSTTTTCPTPATSSSSRSPSATPPTSRAASRCTARCCTAATGCSPSTAPSVPNALAALLLRHPRPDRVRPHIYFEWTEGNPVLNLLRFLLFGVGEVAPITREVLRRAEPDAGAAPTCTPAELRVVPAPQDLGSRDSSTSVHTSVSFLRLVRAS